MTQTLPAKLEPLSIAAAADASRWASWKEYGDADGIALYGPATLDGGIDFTIEVSDDDVTDPLITPVARTMQDDTPLDIAPPLATKARSYFDLPLYAAFRIKASIAVTTPSTWEATKQFKG